MQIVGKKCGECGEAIAFATDGMACPECAAITCKDCAPAEEACPACGRGTLGSETGSASLNSATKPKIKPTDLPPPDEPYLDALGARITESEYVLARRHNIYRWTLSMILGIPTLLALWSFGFFVALVGGAAILPAVYAGVSWFFPASKKHGTAIYRKYANLREMRIAVATRQKG